MARPDTGALDSSLRLVAVKIACNRRQAPSTLRKSLMSKKSSGGLFAAAAVAITMLSAPGAYAAESLARVVADGNPWEMYVVKRRVSNILVFKPDGGGTISDSMVSIHPTWKAVADGICIRTEPQAAEKCLILKRTKEGIEASQGGKAVFILKR